MDGRLERSDFAPLDRSSPIPLYAQLKSRLFPIISRWEDIEQRFYTDEELTRIFDVSRDTARQAISGLVSDGLLTRVRGRGTFVVFPAVEERFNAGMNFEQQWADRGTPMQIRGLAYEMRSADSDIATRLMIPVGTEYLYIKRMRSTAGVPIALDHRYVPAPVAKGWSPEVAEISVLHRVWEEHALKVGDFTITADLADEDVRLHLMLPLGAPVLIRQLRYHNAAGAVLLAGQTVHRADLARYSMQVPLEKPTDGKVSFGTAASLDLNISASSALDALSHLPECE